MATAEQVISQALSLILVRQSESPLRPDEYQSGIETLNDLMTMWDSSGLPLGYTLVDNLSDEITVPAFALLAIKQNLAIQLAPEFGGNIDQMLLSNAAMAKRALYSAVVRAEASCYPSTLPVGSGSSGSSGGRSRRFYPGCPQELLVTEQDGAILLESQTNHGD